MDSYESSLIAKPQFRFFALILLLFAAVGPIGAQTPGALALNESGKAKYAKGDRHGAIADFSKAIEADPQYAMAYNNRGATRDDLGDHDGAIADYRKAIVLDPDYPAPYNALAWLLATYPRPVFRNGNQAIRYARKASELTEWKKPEYLDTLAAAYAEARNFNEAVKWQEKALTFPAFVDSEGELARRRLELYKQRRPYREK